MSEQPQTIEEHPRQPEIAPCRIVPDAYYTARETARFLRISPRTLERRRADQRGPRATKFWEKGRVLYRGEHIIDFMHRHSGNPAQAD